MKIFIRINLMITIVNPDIIKCDFCKRDVDIKLYHDISKKLFHRELSIIEDIKINELTEDIVRDVAMKLDAGIITEPVRDIILKPVHDIKEIMSRDILTLQDNDVVMKLFRVLIRKACDEIETQLVRDIRTNRVDTERFESKGICCKCWDTCGKCKICNRRIKKHSDISYIDVDNKIVCSSCDKRTVKCPACNEEKHISCCRKVCVKKDGKFLHNNFLCRVCMANPKVNYCKGCLKLGASLYKTCRGHMEGPYCSDCYDLELRWI
jgi:hypothetical protein